MTDKIHVGMILLEEGAPLPASLAIGTKPYATGWSCIQSGSAQLGRELEGAGWTFFYMAGVIRTCGFGFDEQSRTDHAMARVIEAVKRENCNCLEITQVRQQSFLGLPYTSLVAHARHVQRSRSFQHLSNLPAEMPSRLRKGLEGPTRSVRSQPLFVGEAVQDWENEGGSRAEA